MKINFLTETALHVVSAAVAAGQTLVTSDVVDTQDYDSVAFVVLLGDVTDTAKLTLTGVTNDTADTVDPVALANPVTFTAGAADADNKLMVIDLHMPRQRYAYVTLARATANAAVNGIIAILYNSHERPQGLTADVIAGQFINDPAAAAA